MFQLMAIISCAVSILVAITIKDDRETLNQFMAIGSGSSSNKRDDEEGIELLT